LIYADRTGIWQRLYSVKVEFKFFVDVFYGKVGSSIVVEIEVEYQSIAFVKAASKPVDEIDPRRKRERGENIRYCQEARKEKKKK